MKKPLEKLGKFEGAWTAILFDREKNQCSKERRTLMKDDSNSWNEEELQMEFDLFVKKSLEKIIRNVLRNYVRDLNRHYAVSIDEMSDEPGKEDDYEIEKISVRTGKVVFPFDTERLAEGYRRLKKKQKMILGMFYALEMPDEAISELTKLQKKSVENYRYEALRILRKYIEEAEDERGV